MAARKTASPLYPPIRPYQRGRLRVSDIHELSLANGSVWVTHGDVFYDNVAPWGHAAPLIRRRFQRLTAHLSADEKRKLDVRYRYLREAVRALPRDYDPNDRRWRAQLARFVRATFPPHRVLIMMKVWLE